MRYWALTVFWDRMRTWVFFHSPAFCSDDNSQKLNGTQGVGIVQDQKVMGSSLGSSGRRIFFSRVISFCADSYFGVSSTFVLPQ